MITSHPSYRESRTPGIFAGLFIIGVLLLLLMFATQTPLDVDVSTSHGETQHGEVVKQIREKCTGSPYWFNPVTRYAIRWCEIGAGKIGYQIMRWGGASWKEVTSFPDKIKQGYTAEQTVAEYLVNSGYVNIEWARSFTK